MISTSLTSLLLVEDEERLRDLVAQFLRGEGYEVIEAADGGEAVDRYRSHGAFDLVLLDLNLPVFSGVEVCRRIKALDVEQKVIICSAAVVHEHEVALLQMNVSRFLTKPYHPDDLIVQIQEELHPKVENRPRPVGSLSTL